MKWDVVWGFNSKHLLYEYHSRLTESKSNQVVVSSLLKLELLAWTDAKADELATCFSYGDIVGMHRNVSVLVKASSKTKHADKVTRVYNDDGVLSQSYGEERVAFRQHFSKLMCADVTSFANVVEKDRVTNPNRFAKVNVEECWKEVPSPSDVMAMHQKAKTNKNLGESLMELFKLLGEKPFLKTFVKNIRIPPTWA